MLGEKLEGSIIGGSVRNVYASVTTEFLAQDCTVFDAHLAELCRELKEVAPRVYFAFDMSAERYGIQFPKGMSTEMAQRVVEKLKTTKLAITDEAHFGCLF